MRRSGRTVTTTYDPTGTPSAIALKNASTTLQSFTYSDAPAGNITNETDVPTSSQSPAAYTYDAKGRVTSMTPGTGSALSYNYDASTNLTTVPTGATGTYDNNSELTSTTLAGTTTNYAYNANGQRLTSKQGSTTITSGTWNGAGELTGYTSPAASMTAATYDGTSLRASATTGSGSQAFTWNTTGQLPELLMDSTNAYLYGTGVAPAEQVNLSTGAITYLTTDSLGSVRGTVNSTGTLTGTTVYDAWGNPETIGGLTSATPFGYAGGYIDPTGLIYLINRYYDPQTGQFTSVDPAVAQTSQPYAYADGNPVSNNDPLGEFCWNWKCLMSTALRIAVFSVIVGISGLAVGACAAATEGVCGIMLGRVIIGAAIGAASSAVACWVQGACHTIKDLATAAFWGGLAGAIGIYMVKVGFSALAANRFKGSFHSLLIRAFSKLRYWRL